MSTDGSPNLLYLHSDQHSPFVTGCYGDPLVETPHIDGLARRGVLLENTYCPSPICVPSRMSMLTGRFPHENRVWTNNHVLDSGIPTLAHAMGAAGLHPVLVGRMHALGPDQLHGYAERLVGDHGPNHSGGKGVDHGELSGTAGPARVSLEKSGPGQSAYQVHDEDVGAAAVDHLNRLGVRRRAGQAAEPFSLSVGFMLPHQPFVARARDFERYAGTMTMPRKPEPFTDSLHPYFSWWRRKCGIEAVTAEEILRARAAYWALVGVLDSLIGDILAALEANGLADNTLIVYTSDHGEQVGEHGLWWKQTFYEESVRVPAVLCWPGELPAGSRCSRVISSLDVNATMLDALGAPPLPTSRGRSLLPILRADGPDGDHSNAGSSLDTATAWRDEAFSEYCTDEGCLHRMVRKGPWKLNYYHGQEPQLFNLEEDPGELRDLAANPDYRDVREELTSRVLDGWDPAEISVRLEELRCDGRILTDWGRNVQPPDRCRWDLRPEMDYLD